MIPICETTNHTNYSYRHVFEALRHIWPTSQWADDKYLAVDSRL